MQRRAKRADFRSRYSAASSFVLPPFLTSLFVEFYVSCMEEVNSLGIILRRVEGCIKKILHILCVSLSLRVNSFVIVCDK